MSNEIVVKADLYHQNWPSGITLAAWVFAMVQFFQTCGTNAIHQYQVNVHSEEAKKACEVPAGREDPRCVGYFAH